MADSIPLSLLEAERAAGWPTIHPEDYCHRCGGRNLSWWIDSDIWNAVLVDATSQWQGILCPQCFTELFEVRWPNAAWRLTLDERTTGAKSFRKAVAHA